MALDPRWSVGPVERTPDGFRFALLDLHAAPVLSFTYENEALAAEGRAHMEQVLEPAILVGPMR